MLRKNKQFPEPPGEYIVGLNEMSFTDPTRQGLFDFAPDEFREIPILIFYPSDDAQNREPSLYSFKEEAESFKKASKGIVSANNRFMPIPAYRDLPVSENQERYPVIFFNHGYSSHMMQNVVLCCDLASQGYIVVSVGHPYEASAIRYPDGRIVMADESIGNEFKHAMALNQPTFKTMKKQSYSDEEIRPAAAHFFENFKSTKVWNHIRIWADDNIFIADMLEKLNEQSSGSPFAGKLDLELGFGITGHSYGGCTASQVCLDDPRFVCGVNIDAPTYGEYWDRDLQKPFMILGSELMDLLARPNFLANSNDAYFIIVESTQHMDFTDMIFYAPQLKLLKLLGKRDKTLLRDVLSSYHLAFFERYLRRKENADMDNLKFEGVRVRSKKAMNPSRNHPTSVSEI